MLFEVEYSLKTATPCEGNPRRILSDYSLPSLFRWFL